ncbi:MAG: maleylpyruvate isomerase family mycothiol-dependent enzyme [Acidimicrobiales bacterium]
MTVSCAANLSKFNADALRFLDVASTCLENPVANCGDWTVRELAVHLGEVYAFVHVNVVSGSMEPADPASIGNGGDPTGDVIGTLAQRYHALADALRATASDDPAWSWTMDKTMGFYYRRMVQETSVHLWDLLDAVGTPEPLDGDFACDGISELFDLLYPNVLTRGIPQPTGSLHLHRTDGEGEWTASVIDGEIVVAKQHAKADAAVKGSASDLNLFLWERVAPDSDDLQVFGDSEVLASWTNLTR